MPDYVTAHINLFGAWDPRFAPQAVFSRQPGAEAIGQLIEYVLGVKLECLTEAVIERFAEASPADLYLPVVPDEQRLVERLLKPLKSAKRLYSLGESLGTIALSGLVGESLAMLVYRMRGISLGGKQIEKSQEQQLFGKDFDALDQIRRIDILHCLGLINDAQRLSFSDLRGVRNKYLHLWEVDNSQLESDAKKCFLTALRLFKEISGVGIGQSGEFIIAPQLLAYIRSV